jgi:hypothetical protein
VAGIPPHDELEKLAEAGHSEGGIWLYRCRRCSASWEFGAWTYFPEESTLRRVGPVASLEKWASKQQRAMKPRSMFVAGGLLFGAGMLWIAVFAGTWWAAEMLFSRAVAEGAAFSVLMAPLLLLYRLAQRQEALRVPKGAEQKAAPGRPRD